MADDRIVNQFAALLEATTGLATSEPNRSHLRRAIMRESKALGRQPEALLRSCAADPRVLQRMIDAAMIGETYFFRESGQFTYLHQTILPALLRGRSEITVWSASCSTGEEAISLAVVLREAARANGSPAIRVHATDIRSNIGDRLHSGRYPASALRRDGSEFHDLLRSQYVAETDECTLLISRELLDLIQVGTVNLFSDPVERLPDNVDVVFFRNTLIYAPEKNRDHIISRVVSRIRPGGHLFLANSELPFVTHPDLDLVEGDGAYCFAKRSPEVTAPVATTSRPATPEPHEPRPMKEPRKAPTTAEVVAEIQTPGRATAPVVAQAARVVAGLFRELDDGRREETARYREELWEIGVEPALLHYCTAWTGYSAGDADAALNAFQAAVTADESLWPAHFYGARLLETRDRSAARDAFAACIRGIEHHPGVDYRFLIGGFEPAQIRSLCVRSIERIDAEHVEYAHGS